MNFSHLILTLAFFMTSTHVYAVACAAAKEPTVYETEVHGFKVFVIDVARGNELGYVFSVPYGSSDDEPSQFGRAHYFEHMFSRGSRRYPGHETLINAASERGISRNAATGFSYTYYYGKGKEDRALEALQMHLAPLESPQFDSSSMRREKDTVINEVVTLAPNQPERALFMLPFMILPKVSHPQRGIYLGNLDTLKPMAEANLRELEQRIYNASNVQIAVFGNFTSGKWKLEQVLATLQASLPEKSVKSLVPYTPTPSPSIFPENKVLEIISTNKRSGILMIPAHSDVNLNNLRNFLNVFSTPFKNGPLDILKSKLDWVKSVGGEVVRIGAHQMVFLSFEMTDSGYAKRDQIVAWLIDNLRQFQTESVPESVVAQYRAANQRGYEELETNIGLLIGVYSKWLSDPSRLDHVHMQWTKITNDFTSESILRGAQSLDLTQRTVSFMGPDAQNADRENAYFKVKYGIRPLPENLNLKDIPNAHPRSIELPNVPQLQELDITEASRHFESAGGWTEISDFDSIWANRTLALKFQFGSLTSLEQLSLEAWINNISDQLTPELSFLSSEGIDLNLGSSNGELAILAQGSTGQEANAIEWLTHQLMARPLKEDILERFKNTASRSLRNSENGFPGVVALDILRELISLRETNSLVAEQNISSVNTETIHNFMRGPLQRSNKVLLIGGAHNPLEIVKLRALAQDISPQNLQSSVTSLFARRNVRENLTHSEPWRDPNKNGLGLVRIYSAPSTEAIVDRAALAIITSILHTSVFVRNRPLGYIQGVTMIQSSPFDSFVTFYGQADGPEQMQVVRNIWNEELSHWKNAEITEAQIENARTGLLATLTRSPGTSVEMVNKMAASFQISDNPFNGDRLVEAISHVTREQIYAAYYRYLNDRSQLDIIKGEPSVQSCEAILLGRQNLREKIKVPKHR